MEYWHRREGGLYLDATAGAGGHTEALLDLDPKARCIAVDRDESAIRIAKQNLERFGDRVTFVKDCFENMKNILHSNGTDRCDGMLFDLGMSSMQVDSAERGFSFSRGGPLDMRMDVSIGKSAAELIRDSDVNELAGIIEEYGEERFARPIASALKKAQSRGKLLDSRECAEIISDTVSNIRRSAPEKIHPATRTFQALRIAVNHELEQLDRSLGNAPALLSPSGRIVYISYHSLEDRRVKSAFKSWSKGCVCPADFPKCVCGRKPEFSILTRKAVKPDQGEMSVNPRSRSARLRAAEKI